MGAGGGFKGLGGDHQTDVEDDRHPGFDRHDLAHDAKEPQQAGRPHQEAVQPGVADAGPHPFPAGMSDVDRGRKAGPHPRGDHGAQAIDQEGAAHGVAVPGGLGALDVLQGTQHVEEAHRHDHPEPGQQLSARRPEAAELQVGPAPADLGRLLGPALGIGVDQATAPGQDTAHQHREQPAGDREADLAVIGGQDHRQDRQPHQGLGVGAQQEAQGDVAQRNARQGGEQGRPRQPAPEPIGAEGSAGFDQARAQAGHQTRLPGEPHGGGLIEALAEGGELHRQHHQKDVGEEADRVDAIGQGRAVIAPLPLRQPIGLQGVGAIADQQADARGGQDRAKDQGIGVAQNPPAEPKDQEDLDQVVQAQAQKAIQVAADPPARSRLARVRHDHGGSCITSSMQASWNGTVIAESDDIVVVEGNPYFPRAALKQEFFRDSSHTSSCGWKGTCRYWDVVVNGEVNANCAWSYETPKPAAAEITERVAFWKGVKVS